MKIAIIGGGIVGSTTAFYLSQTNHQVTLFDNSTGQATKAAAGIICPWFSKRRNKPWYRLANDGAHFYPQLLADLSQNGLSTKAYQKKTTWLLKKKAKLVDELITIANNRKKNAPLIGDIKKLSPADQQDRLAGWSYQHDLIQVEGAAVVDGETLCADLQEVAQKNGVTLTLEKADIQSISADQLDVNNISFDKVIITAGPWLKEILSPHGYDVDVRAQKGQLAVYHTRFDTDHWPLIIPEGEGDIIPHHQGKIFIGATHEDSATFDLTVEEAPLLPLFSSLQPLLPDFDFTHYDQIKVGSRAFTSDYAPFFGPLFDNKNILAASGLGSSGLTTGPIIGYNLAQLALGESLSLDISNYSTERYITK